MRARGGGRGRHAIRGRSGRPLCRVSLCASRGRECRRLTWRENGGWSWGRGRECGERESGRAAGCFMYDCGRELSGSSGRDEAPPWQWLSRAPPWKVSTANQPPSPTHRATNSRTTSPAPHRTRNPPPPRNGSRIPVLCSSGEIRRRRSLAQTRRVRPPMELVGRGGPKACGHRRPDLRADAAGDF